MDDTLWYKDAVFYEVYVRAFNDSNGDGHGDIRGLTQKLDYFLDLGVDCLWLLPVYPSPLLDGGYDIADYYDIHPDYGTLDDFKTFLKAARERGLKVIADLVLNHTSNQHPWFQKARAARSSPYRDYYVWSDTDQKYREARIIFRDTERSNWTWDEQAGQYYWHRFYSSQPDLNYDNPQVRKEMIKVLNFWLKHGVDGFRADAVPYLYEREGTKCENLPKTHAYLRRVRRYIDKKYPGCILLAEANQWPKDLRRYFRTRKSEQFHMGFHFPLMPRIFMALRKEDSTPIVNILKQTPAIPDNAQWCTFLRNHDELTLEMVTEEERQWMWNEYAPHPRMRLNLGIRRRLAPLLDNDRRKIELAYSILFALPGSPVIYYGDEIGMGDNIWLHDRDGLRTPMQWDSSPNAGFSAASPEQLYAPVIDDETYGYQRVNVAAQREDRNSLWHRLRHMIAVRKRHKTFSWGSHELLRVKSRSVLSVARAHAGETIVCLHNLSPRDQRVELDMNRWPGAHVADLLSNQSYPAVTSAPYTLSLKPYSYHWFILTP